MERVGLNVKLTRYRAESPLHSSGTHFSIADEPNVAMHFIGTALAQSFYVEREVPLFPGFRVSHDRLPFR